MTKIKKVEYELARIRRKIEITKCRFHRGNRKRLIN